MHPDTAGAPAAPTGWTHAHSRARARARPDEVLGQVALVGPQGVGRHTLKTLLTEMYPDQYDICVPRECQTRESRKRGLCA